MQNSKLIRVLRAFDRTEFKQFGKFAASPYFSSGRNLLPLFNILKEFYPDFDGTAFTKESVIDSLARDGFKAGSGVLKTQMSEMYRLAELFLSIQAGMKETGLMTYYFAGTCRKKSLFRIGESKIRKTIKDIEAGSIDGNFYQNYYYSMVELVNFSFVNDKPLEGWESLKHLAEIILHNYLCMASRYIYNLTQLNIGFNVSPKDNLLLSFFVNTDFESLMSGLAQKNDRFSKASMVYALLIEMMLKPDDGQVYFKFKDALMKNIDGFGVYEQSFFLQTITHKIAGLSFGPRYKEFGKEFLEILKYRISKGLHKQHPGAAYTSNEFFAAVYAGFILKEKQWLQHFIETHSGEVPKEEVKQMVLIGRAFIYFLDGEYTETLKIIDRLKDIPFLINYDLKRFRLMVFYETDMINEAFYAVDAFRAFLKKNSKVSGFFQEQNINFIKYYLQLIKHKLKEESIDLTRLKTLAEMTSTANKEWIIEKIEELN